MNWFCWYLIKNALQNYKYMKNREAIEKFINLIKPFPFEWFINPTTIVES